MTKPNEPEGMEPCPFCGAIEHLHVSKCGSLLGDMPGRPYRVVCDHIDHDQVQGPVAYGRMEAIAAWNRRAPAQPVADAGGVTAADHEAAAAYLKSMGKLASVARPRNPLTPSGGPLSQAFARHRLQSVAAATAAKDAAFLEAAQLVFCIEAAGAIEFEGENFTRWKEKARSIAPSLRAALSEAREAGE